MIWILLVSAIVIVALQQWIEFGELWDVKVWTSIYI